jgi:hypothetical protein
MMDRRTELKQEYKNRPRSIGVFKVENIENGKIFIGSSLNVDKVFNRLKFSLSNGDNHLNQDLLKDWREYGEKNFTFEILDQLKPDEDPQYNYKEDLETLEALWLEKLQPYDDKGYNKRKN